MSTKSDTKGAAIVTGSAQGIGLSIAHKLAEDGYAVVLNDLPQKHDQLSRCVEEIKRDGFRALAITGDVAIEADVKTLVQKAVDEFGQLDVVCASPLYCFLAKLILFVCFRW
jgi:NAD(P)-dependent dehydrogenase (short-subunit alcohol dehydrogenase family)